MSATRTNLMQNSPEVGGMLGDVMVLMENYGAVENW